MVSVLRCRRTTSGEFDPSFPESSRHYRRFRDGESIGEYDGYAATPAAVQSIDVAVLVQENRGIDSRQSMRISVDSPKVFGGIPAHYATLRHRDRNFIVCGIEGGTICVGNDTDYLSRAIVFDSKFSRYTAIYTNNTQVLTAPNKHDSLSSGTR